MSDFPSWWNEESYLAANSDVALAIDQSIFSSGYDHYVAHGFQEGRSAGIYDPDVELWDEAAYLAFNPDVALAVSSGRIAGGRLHYKINGKNEGRFFAYSSAIKNFKFPHQLPEWFIKQIASASALDPESLPLDLISKSMSTIELASDNDRFQNLFKRICLSLPRANYTHIYMLPWVKKGGSDLELINIINFAAARTGTDVGLILSENTSSEWLSRISSNVDVFDLGCEELRPSSAEKESLVLRFLLQKRPSLVHVSNCNVGWNLLTREGSSLSAFSRLYVSLFCYDYTTGGEPVGYARRLGYAIPFLSGVWTDNRTFGDHLVTHYGVRADSIENIKFPIDPVRQFPISDRVAKRVLWASRLDTQKRPELLASIARLAPDIQFDVFGSAVLGDEISALSHFDALPNLIWKGPYSGFDSIPREPYGCFLYTSAWDGLPNIVLEVMSSGLPLVTANIGGIKEVVDPSAGWLIDDHCNPEAYLLALQEIFLCPELAERKKAVALSRVELRHSREQFELTLLSVPGYF